MPYQARQRWFYTNFCGRTQRSIFESECAYQTEIQNKQFGFYHDPLSWSMPEIDNNAAAAILGQPLVYSNYIDLVNGRPANPYTGRGSLIGVADPLYIATRHAFTRAAYRIALYTPSAAEIAAVGSTGANDTYLGFGFEVNSQGSHLIYAIELLDDGAALQWQMRAYTPGATQKIIDVDSIIRPLTINNPGAWNWFEVEYDPPVFRFTQPGAGQVNYWVAAGNPTITELSVPELAAQPMVQPMIFNESEVSTYGTLTFLMNQWAIWPLSHEGNAYDLEYRTNPTEGNLELIFDTGGRPHVQVTVVSIAASQNVNIHGTNLGQNQVAAMPLVRTWWPIRFAQTGAALDPDSRYSYYGFIDNAHRFIRVTLTETSGTGTQHIIIQANE